WVDLHVERDGRWYREPVLLELDRATEHAPKWRHKVAAILAFLKGPYAERFGTTAVTVAVVVAPKDGTLPDKRRQDLVRWTEAELTAQGEHAEAETFLFTSLPPASDSQQLFLAPVWQRPFAPHASPLIEGVDRV